MPPIVTKMSGRGLLALARHEGVAPAPYRNAGDKWTFGIGHTSAAGPPDPALMPRGMPADPDAGIREAFRVFRVDIARYEAEVLRALEVPVAQHEFDALVSFHFHTGGIAEARLTRFLNAGDRAAAADAFMGWSKPPSVIPRREAEQRLFRDGIYPEGRIPVWAVDRAGRVDFSQPIRSLTEREALALMRPEQTAPPPATEPAPEPAPDAPTGWLARLAAFLTTLIRRT